MRIASRLLRGGQRPGSRGARGREARAALASCAALYLLGGTLTAGSALLPHVDSPAGVAAIGVTAWVTAGGLALAYAHSDEGLSIAWLADLWGVALIALLCAATGGADSPFGLIYFFAIGHAAAFQPRARLAAVCLAALVAFLAPLVYGGAPSSFGAIALVGITLALLCTALVHLALERIRDQRWRLEFLINATANLDTTLDPQRTLQRIARTAVPELADLCVIDLVDADGTITSTVAASVDPALASAMEHMRRKYPLGIRGAHPVARALRAGERFVAQDLNASTALRRAAEQGADEQARFLLQAGATAAAIFPMVARGRWLGAVSFLRLREGAPYEPGQLTLLEDLTGRAALAFDNARLYAERARVARTLRRSLMPARLPQVAGLELASFFRPTGAPNEVGGDFFDVFADKSGCWLIVGDVCGKGAEAAVLTGFLRHTTLAYAREDAPPADVLERVNAAMLEQDFDERFATAILARLRLQDGGAALTVAAAGHPAALIVRGSGAAEAFGEHGTLLGVFEDPEIVERSTLLAPGDALALYTDGLAEAHAPEQTLTVEQMLDALARAAPVVAQEAIDALVGLIAAGEGPPRDDVAVLAALIAPAHPARPAATAAAAPAAAPPA